jgi:predicted methyltransferase
MLPTARVSPYADAERKVALIEPRGKRILDTCGGLGYFAAWAVERLARHVLSYEKNPDVCWLREVNPWSPAASGALTLIQDDITRAVTGIEAAAFDAVLHDPPRFGIAGDLYSQRFYEQLARVLRRGGSMFHYTGNPQKWSSGRDLGGEVLRRLRCAGFRGEKIGDGILAVKG